MDKLATLRVIWAESIRNRDKDPNTHFVRRWTALNFCDAPVRARPGRLSSLSVLHSKSVLYGAFVWCSTTKHGMNWPGQFLRQMEEADVQMLADAAWCRRTCDWFDEAFASPGELVILPDPERQSASQAYSRRILLQGSLRSPSSGTSGTTTPSSRCSPSTSARCRRRPAVPRASAPTCGRWR
jgi:hypothetical protein